MFENRIPKVFILSPSIGTLSCIWVGKTVLVTLFTTNFYHEVMTIVPTLNPVTPIEDVLKNGSTDNALPLVWALSVTKRERVHCWCCIPAGTIPLFSRPQSGRLNWTTPPCPPPSPYTPPFPLCSPTNQPTNQPTHHPLLPYTHPLVSCPYLGRDVLSAGWRGGTGGREGGRWVDTREAGGETVSTHSPFLIRTCLEFRPLSRWRASLFRSTSLEHTLVSTWSSIEVVRSAC